MQTCMLRTVLLLSLLASTRSEINVPVQWWNNDHCEGDSVGDVVLETSNCASVPDGWPFGKFYSAGCGAATSDAEWYINSFEGADPNNGTCLQEMSVLTWTGTNCVAEFGKSFRVECVEQLGGWEVRALRGVRTFTSVLTFVGCSGMIIMFILYPAKLLKPPTTLVLHLAIVGLLESFTNLIGESSSSAACIMEAFGIQAFRLSFSVWNLCVSHCLYVAVVDHGIAPAKFRKLHIGYSVAAYGVPLLLAFILLGTDVYGDSGAWCWVKPTHVAVRWGLFYVPVFITFLGCIALRILVVRYVRGVAALTTTGGDSDHMAKVTTMLQRLVLRMGGYSVVFIVCYFFAFMNRIDNAASPNHPKFALYLMQTLTQPLEGALNAIIFFYVHRKLLPWFSRSDNSVSKPGSEDGQHYRPF